METRAPANWVPDRAEIIWIQHSPATGVPDLHPMLVASTRAFNEKVGIVIGFPMTHSTLHSDDPFALPIQGPKGASLGRCIASQKLRLACARCKAAPVGWRLASVAR